MATETYLFPTQELRDIAWETEIARGTRGVTRFTEQQDGKMLYVLAVPVPHNVVKKTRLSSSAPEKIAENAIVSEGGTDV